MPAPISKRRYTSVQLASSIVIVNVLSGGVTGLFLLHCRLRHDASKNEEMKRHLENFFMKKP